MTHFILHYIFDFCIKQNCWVSAAHIPAVDNTTADNQSRHFCDNTEWQLLPEHFTAITQSLNFMPTVDLFASRIDLQLNEYISWHPDPNAMLLLFHGPISSYMLFLPLAS